MTYEIVSPSGRNGVSQKSQIFGGGNDSLPLKAIKDFLGKNKAKTAFLEHEVKMLLKEMGLSVPNGIFIGRDMACHVPVMLDLTYPLAAKISSSKISSKSDVGGIRLSIKNRDDLQKAVDELFEIKDAEGVLIEEMSPPGIEVIVGGIFDQQFGPTVMFGLGGIFVELFNDIAFALAPLKEKDTLWLIQQVKGYKLIEGYRGRPAVDKDALIKTILAVSEIMSSGDVEEIDLNPVALYEKGAIVLDAKMKIKPE